MKFDKRDLLLYAVTDRSWLGGQTLYEQVEDALKGGATFVQLREKELDDAAFLAEATEIQAICRRYQVPFVINDNVEIAGKVVGATLDAAQQEKLVDSFLEELGEQV